MIKEISIVGTGNLAYHFVQMISCVDGLNINEIIGRHEKIPKAFRKFELNYSSDISNILKSDLYLILVSDDYIKDICLNLKNLNGIVSHCSGSIDIEVLKECNNYGVIYPFQTFSMKSKLDYSKIPFLLEASDNEVKYQLNEFISKISKNISFENSESRFIYHITAVIINNFTNHLIVKSQQIIKSNNLNFEFLHPLIEETIKKTEVISALEAQTGPAKRNDKITMEKHIDYLKKYDVEKLYRAISDSIINTNFMKDEL